MVRATREGRLLRAGQLARRCGVSSDTLRHYERKGVLQRPRRLDNGYRAYPPEAESQVRRVRRALALGFTLDEIAAFFQARDRGAAPCREVRDMAAEKLRRTEEQIRDLVALRDELAGLLSRWDSLLSAAAGARAAHLLELENLPATESRPTGLRKKKTEKEQGK